MLTGWKRPLPPRNLYEFSIKHNILVPIILLIIAFIFKVLDIFVFKLDELLGEIIVSKSLGFLLIAVYLWTIGKSLTTIGLHRRSLGEALIIGATGVAIVIVMSYGLQFSALIGAGKQPSLVFTAIDPRTGMTGGLLFALFLVFGNFVNSFMEEGLFRGIMLRHFRVSLSFWRANFLQATLFGLWHLTVPVKGFITGQLNPSEATLQGVMMVAGTAMFGFAMGYLYLKTDNLWAPWLAHTINNSLLNVIHIQTVDGIDSSDVIIFQAALSIGFIVIMLLFRRLAKRFQMPEVKPLGQEAS